jgi:hypothetical protein
MKEYRTLEARQDEDAKAGRVEPFAGKIALKRAARALFVKGGAK